MKWEYTSQNLPPNDDTTLYYVAYVSRLGSKTRVGDVYLTGRQIRKQLTGFWWRVYAYSLYEPITAPPLI